MRCSCVSQSKAGSTIWQIHSINPYILHNLLSYGRIYRHYLFLPTTKVIHIIFTFLFSSILSLTPSFCSLPFFHFATFFLNVWLPRFQPLFDQGECNLWWQRYTVYTSVPIQGHGKRGLHSATRSVSLQLWGGLCHHQTSKCICFPFCPLQEKENVELIKSVPK